MYAKTLVSVFLKPRSMVFLIMDKTDHSHHLKCQNLWLEILMTMAPYGINAEDSTSVV